MPQYKIIFFITTVGHGQGGHFYSLASICKALQSIADVYIINIGKKKSPVLDPLPNVKFIYFEKLKIFSIIKEIVNEINIIKPNILHAFDVESLFFVRWSSYRLKIPYVLTKCGGPNPKKYFPKVPNLIVFSNENYIYFSKNKLFNNTFLHLIPNRVIKPNSDEKRIEELKKKYFITDEYVILRIGRITKHYKTTIVQAINLVKQLNLLGLKSKLLIIGTIQEESLFNHLVQYADDEGIKHHVIFETNEQFTKNASQLIAISDIVIGTGRGFMEACAFNKIMLVPNENKNFPIIVDNDNFMETFSLNFSPRSKDINYNEEKNLYKIQQALMNKNNNYNSEEWFKQYFDVMQVADKYKNVYDNLNKDTSIKLVDFVLHAFKLFKTFS